MVTFCPWLFLSWKQFMSIISHKIGVFRIAHRNIFLNFSISISGRMLLLFSVNMLSPGLTSPDMVEKAMMNPSSFNIFIVSLLYSLYGYAKSSLSPGSSSNHSLILPAVLSPDNFCHSQADESYGYDKHTRKHRYAPPFPPN